MLKAIIILGALGLAAGILLVMAFKIAPSIEERIEKVADSLPGENCGGCGCHSCRGLAESYMKGEADLNDCVERKKWSRH